MNILVIADDSSIIGGSTTFCHEIAKNLIKIGHKVYLVEAYSKRNSDCDELAGVEVNRYYIKPKIFFQVNLPIFFNSIRIAKKIIRKNKIDVIHLHLNTPSLAVFLSNLAPKVPKVIHFYGASYLETISKLDKPNHKILGALKRAINFGPKIFFQKTIQQYNLNKADRIIVLSRFCRDIVIEKFNILEEKLTVMGGGVDFEIFYPLEEKEKLRLKANIGFSKNTDILLIAARIEPRKGIENVIKSMKAVISNNPNTILLIVSPLQGWDELTLLYQYYNLVSELGLGGKVVFTTSLKGRQLARYYQIAKCFIMSSTELETFGLTTVEALACGTPVLGTNTGATPEILSKVDKRLMIENLDPKVYSEKINWLLGLDKRQYDEICRKCINRSKNYEWLKQTIILEKTYNIML